MKSSQKGDSFRKRVRELRKQFWTAVRLFERENVDTAVQSTRDILEKTSGLIDDVTEDYRSALMNKLPNLDSDKNFIEKAASQAQPTDNPKFMAFLSNLNSTLRVAETEVKNNYPAPWPPVTWMRKNARPIVIVSAVAAALMTGAWILRATQMRGIGLRGTYFADGDLEKSFRERVDRTLDFNWKTGSPFRGWRKDDFSVRWTGGIRIPNDGNYEFFITSDDGVRMKIDGSMIINNWTVHRETVDRAAMPLSAGLHPIEIEYFERKKSAVLKLQWKRNEQDRPVVVPASALVPNLDALP